SGVKKEKLRIETINYIFCSDKFLRKINKQFLNHDYFTDIITFPHEQFTAHIGGDIYISLDRVRENAEEFNQSFTNELHRVMAHGVLHLCGYGDKSEAEEKLMRKMEEKWLKARNFT
nr:rRNA maturation RNase YbeY [Bacteroidia bacterium]